jgi:acyl-coenzyme A thioesterase PaaI-like protein
MLRVLASARTTRADSTFRGSNLADKTPKITVIFSSPAYHPPRRWDTPAHRPRGVPGSCPEHTVSIRLGLTYLDRMIRGLSAVLRRQFRDWLTDHLGVLLNAYPPYLGAGIRVVYASPDFRRVRVAMKLNALNRNYVGTHFGGSLYAMCDPFYMLILMRHLGRDYIVWDKAASIEFKRPGRGTVTATFEVSPERVEQIRRDVDAHTKVEPRFHVDVLDREGQVVARVEKVLYVRKKPTKQPREASAQPGNRV